MSNVVIRGSSTTIEDWERANRATRKELPNLTDEEKEVSRKLGISEEDYARNRLAMQYGQERLRNRVEILRTKLTDLVKELNENVNVVLLSFDVWQGEYTVSLKKNHREIRCKFSRELGNDILDSSDQSSLAVLKKRLKKAIEEACLV